jgi:DNA-binding MarR family transcriptional regulator
VSDDILKLSNQLCFPLYAAAKGVVGKYTPFLEPLGLTYTQYITLMVLWERKSVTIKELGEQLYLDSGTLTPMLKKLAERELVERSRSKTDERSVIVTITRKGEELKARAAEVPLKMAKCMPLPQEDAGALYALLYKILEAL